MFSFINPWNLKEYQWMWDLTRFEKKTNLYSTKTKNNSFSFSFYGDMEEKSELKDVTILFEDDNDDVAIFSFDERTKNERLRLAVLNKLGETKLY